MNSTPPAITVSQLPLATRPIAKERKEVSSFTKHTNEEESKNIQSGIIVTYCWQYQNACSLHCLL